MTSDPELINKYKQQALGINTVQQTSFSSMSVNNAELKGGTNLVSKSTQITRRDKAVKKVAPTLPLAFTTFIDDQDGFNLKIAGDRDVPEKVFVPDGFQLVSIANFRKEGDSVSYDAIYRKKTAQRFFKQVGVIPDTVIGGGRIKPVVQYFDLFPPPVPCRLVIPSGANSTPLFVSDDVVFEFGQNTGVIFIGDVPISIQASTLDGNQFVYYISDRTPNPIQENSGRYVRGVSNIGGYIFDEKSFLVSKILNNFNSIPTIPLLENLGGAFTVARSRDDLPQLNKYTVRVSKIVDGEEETFVEIPDLYEQGTARFSRFERATGSTAKSESAVSFNGGIISVYGDLAVFWKYEYFEVENISNAYNINGDLVFTAKSGYSSSYIKATVGYANLSTKEIVLNYKNIDVRLLVNGRDIEKEPIDYPISWDGVAPTFLPTVFALRQSFKIDNGVISRAIDFSFWASYVATNADSILINYSNGVFTNDSEIDKDGFIIFDDLKYRLYIGENFEVLPRNFFELPIPTKTVDSKVVEDTEKYFKDIETFFDKSLSSFFNGLKSYLPWLQLTEDLTIVLFIGQPTEIVEVDIGGGQTEMRRLPVDGKILYITRTTENKFEGEFIEEEYLTFEKPLSYTPNFKNITIEKV